MEWIPRAKAPESSVSPQELKVCELCGTLNHDNNRECFTCGWHGQFGHDATTIDLAWQRLAHQHEGVLMEHVTARNTPLVGDFGQRQQTNSLQRFQSRCRHWWKAMFSGRTHHVVHHHHAETRQPATPQGDN